MITIKSRDPGSAQFTYPKLSNEIKSSASHIVITHFFTRRCEVQSPRPHIGMHFLRTVILLLIYLLLKELYFFLEPLGSTPRIRRYLQNMLKVVAQSLPDFVGRRRWRQSSPRVVSNQWWTRGRKRINIATCFACALKGISFGYHWSWYSDYVNFENAWTAFEAHRKLETAMISNDSTTKWIFLTLFVSCTWPRVYRTSPAQHMQIFHRTGLAVYVLRSYAGN